MSVAPLPEQDAIASTRRIAVGCSRDLYGATLLRPVWVLRRCLLSRNDLRHGSAYTGRVRTGTFPEPRKRTAELLDLPCLLFKNLDTKVDALVTDGSALPGYELFHGVA